MTSASHTSFVIERRFAAPPAAVFGAWADLEAKKRWSDCHVDEGETELTMDFRPGGRESYRAQLPDGRVVHRVRVGPFAKPEDMNPMRARLSDAGFNASVSRSQ